jgi:hypothetical protein
MAQRTYAKFLILFFISLLLTLVVSSQTQWLGDLQITGRLSNGTWTGARPTRRFLVAETDAANSPTLTRGASAVDTTIGAGFRGAYDALLVTMDSSAPPDNGQGADNEGGLYIGSAIARDGMSIFGMHFDVRTTGTREGNIYGFEVDLSRKATATAGKEMFGIVVANAPVAEDPGTARKPDYGLSIGANTFSPGAPNFVQAVRLADYDNGILLVSDNPGIQLRASTAVTTNPNNILLNVRNSADTANHLEIAKQGWILVGTKKIGETISTPSTSKVVTFASAGLENQANNSYMIYCTPSWVSGCAVTAKTTSQFQLNYTDPGSAQTIDWILFR